MKRFGRVASALLGLMVLAAPAIALAGEVGSPFWVDDRSITSLQHTPWNDVHVTVSGATFNCGLGATNSATLLDEHVGDPSKGAMLSMLLAASLAGRPVDLEVIRHDGTSANHCAIRRVRLE